MNFNNDQTGLGYEKLTTHMKEIILFVHYYMLGKYNYLITITDTFRSQESQDHIYRNNEKYKKKKFMSVHQCGRGCDISVKNMTNEMIAGLVTVLNTIKYSDKYKTATYHDVGSGIHIHIQVPHTRCKQNEKK